MVIVPFLIHKLPDGLISLTAVGRVEKTVRGEVGNFRQVTHFFFFFFCRKREFLESDRQYTCEELAQELD